MELTSCFLVPSEEESDETVFLAANPDILDIKKAKSISVKNFIDFDLFANALKFFSIFLKLLFKNSISYFYSFLICI